MADLDHEAAARFQHPQDLGREGAVGVQPVRTSIQGRHRLVLAHLGVEGEDLVGADIGRVGDHQVEGIRLQARGPIAAEQGRAAGEAEVGGVLAGHGQGFLGNVHAQAPCRGALGQQGQQDGARADAEVEDARGPARLQPLQGGDHHQLGVGARRQHLRPDVQHDGPEALATQDVGDGFAPFAAAEVGLQRLRLLGGEAPLRIVQQVGPRGAGGRLEQQARVDHRAVDPGGLQPVTGGGPGLHQSGHRIAELPSRTSPEARTST